MSLSSFRDDPGRLDRSHELHARPFPEIAAPATALCIALRPDGHGDPASFDAHLDALLAHYGADRPAPGAKHHYGKIGAHFLKWERHTEFFSYTFFVENPGGDPFDPPRNLFPPEWAKTAPGRVVAATLVHVRHCPEAEDLSGFLAEAVAPHFVPESLAISHVLDQAAIIASDFRIDANGFTRAMVLAQPETGQRRLGRITQRLIEIENYKSMAMLTLPIAQAAAAELTEMDRLLSGIVADYAASDSDHEATLTKLLEVSADIEHLIARNEDRFSAAKAYGAIVGQRIAVLRETRLGGRQTLEEFMLRRFDPALRTCAATHARLAAVAARAARAGEMLRTRTDFSREEQNQEILARMDARAATQLRLQKTVEGLSVVAVSYYAVNLASYFLAPFAQGFGIGKAWLTAALVLPVLAIVWGFIQRLKRHI